MTSYERLFSSLGLLAAIFVASAGNTQASYAATKTASFTVQARVMSSCQIQWNRQAGALVQLNQECATNSWQINTEASFDKTSVFTSIDF